MIDNALPTGFVSVDKVDHTGITIGWVAGSGHIVETRRLPIIRVLTDVPARHRDVRLIMLGLDRDTQPSLRHRGTVSYQHPASQIADGGSAGEQRHGHRHRHRHRPSIISPGAGKKPS